jgi:hypothetical protein
MKKSKTDLVQFYRYNESCEYYLRSTEDENSTKYVIPTQDVGARWWDGNRVQNVCERALWSEARAIPQYLGGDARAHVMDTLLWTYEVT